MLFLFVFALQIHHVEKLFKNPIPKVVPQNATYLKIETFGYFNDVGGMQPILIMAMSPLDNQDTTYNGTVYLHTIESNSNNSVIFISDWTGLPTDSAHLYGGQAIAWVTDTEPETVGIYVTDSAGILKSSIPVGLFIDSATTTAIPMKALIEGPDTTNAMSIDGALPDIFYFSVIDSFGKVDTAICDLFDTTIIRVRIIDDPDSSAFFYSPARDTYTREVNLAMFKGRGWLYLFDYTYTSETVTIVAEDIDTISNFGDDTFHLYVTAENKATKLVPYSFSGPYGNVNANKVFYTLAWLEGTDPTNNSTQARITARDIFGTQSINVDPNSFQTLKNGAYSFKVLDTETDSFAFIFSEAQGLPYLYPYMPILVTSFKDTGIATMLKGAIPTMIPVNDTIYCEVYAVDMFDNIDSSYDGWIAIYGDDEQGYWSIHFVDTLGDTSTCYPINNGVAKFGFYDTESESIKIKYEDAEGEEPLTYLGKGFTDKLKIWVSPSGSTATKWSLTEHNHITMPDHYIIVTVAALDDSGRIDASFSDTSLLSITGNAVVFPETLKLNHGIGIVGVYDTTYETVYLTATGAGLTNALDTLMFIPPDSAAYIIVDDFGENCVNDTAILPGWIMTPEYTLANYYNGSVKTIIYDTTRNLSSVYCFTNPNNIPVTNGTFSLKFLDSEPEYVSMDIVDLNGKLMPGKAKGLFYGNLDKHLDGPHLVNEEDTINVYLLDAFNNIIPLNSVSHSDTIYSGISQIGGSDPYSVNYTSPFKSGFSNGHASFTFYDTESETLYILVESYNSDLYHNGGTVAYQYYAGIESNLKVFRVSINTIQNKKLRFEYAIPRKGNVKISIFDLVGREIVREDKILNAGKYTFSKDKLHSGIYYIRLKYNNSTKSKKVVLFR